MHRISKLLALLLLTAAMGLPANARSDALDCARQTASRADLTRLVDSIDGIALTQSSWPMDPWPLARNPFTDWYVRFIVAMGTSTPPSTVERSDAAALIRDVSALPGEKSAAAIWAGKSDTTLDDTASAFLQQSLCVRVVNGTGAMGRRAPSTVEPLMRNWLDMQARKSATTMGESADFINRLSDRATVGTARSSHPFNVLVAAGMTAAFGKEIAAVPAYPTVPYYDDGHVQGIRLDASSHVSLYVFAGSDADLLSFVQSFHHPAYDAATQALVPRYAVDHWKSIQAQFKATPVAMAPIDLDVLGRQQFIPSLDASAPHIESYGTTINAPYNMSTGLSQTHLSLRDGHFSLFTVSGVEGTNAPPRLTFDMSPIHLQPMFAVPALLYYVVDDQNGLILSYGFQHSWR